MEGWVENFPETSKMHFDAHAEAFFPVTIVSLNGSTVKVKFIAKGLNADEIAVKYVMQRASVKNVYYSIKKYFR